MIRLLVSLVLAASLLRASECLHNDPVPLRGFVCKQDAQQPCQLCPDGYYCVSKIIPPEPCGGNHVYCPLGSVAPTTVSDGFYSIGPTNSTRNAELQCEPGFYCRGGVKIVCPAGFHCPTPGMSEPLLCGDRAVFCPKGSIEPSKVSTGFVSVGSTDSTSEEQAIAPPGYYAVDGIAYVCPEGHFGDREGSSDDNCSGICRAGWFCPAASTSSMQRRCGSEDRFCPPGSATPRIVQTGYYTATIEEPCRPGYYRESKPDGEADVSPITTSRAQGSCILCPQGTYKHLSGDDLSMCLDCTTKAASTPGRMTCKCHQSATERFHFELIFDPVQAKCTSDPPETDDWAAPGTQETKSEEMPCEKGHYCEGGVRYKCPAGRYGDKEMEEVQDCAGACREGYWCGEGSTSPTQNKCGAPNLYCPSQSSAPMYVSEGYYTKEDEPDNAKTAQQICPKGYWCADTGLRHPCEAGTFGDQLELSDEACSGVCSPGYYCPKASVSPRQNPCGNSTVYCPMGSSLPNVVEDGFYTAAESDAIASNYAGPNATQSMQVLCEVGYYCKDGIKYQCPAGTFGHQVGAADVFDCKPCSPGMFCPSYPGPPTTEDTQLPCGGDLDENDAHLYCPEGSHEPLTVDLGYYSITEFADSKQGLDTKHTRTAQVQCEHGFVCTNGVRYPCRAGTYGKTSGLYDEDCSGMCPRGFFCPENSIEPLPCSPGAYSTGGASDCTSCEVPASVPVELLHSMCRDDRSCCLKVFD